MTRKNIHKKSLSLVLTLALMVSALGGCAGQGTLFGYSPGQDDAQADAVKSTFSEYELHLIDGALMAPELEPKLFMGRDSISIPLQLGNEINSYYLNSVNSKNHRLPVHNFSVFSDGVIVAILHTWITPSGDFSCQLNTDFGDKLEAFMERNESVAIVRTDSAAYAASEKEVVLFGIDPGAGPDQPELRPKDIPSFVEFTVPTMGPYERFEVPSLGYATFDGEPFVLEAPSRVLPASYNLNVPVVTQAVGQTRCWAASTACIANYLKGTAYTTDSFYNAAVALGLYVPNLGPNGQDSGANVYNITSMIGEMFGIQSSPYDMGGMNWFTILPRPILESVVVGKPVYTSMAAVSGSGKHAVVSCGYDSLSGNSCYIRYMDPNQPSIQRAPVSNIDDRAAYTCSVNSEQYVLNGYVLIQ